MDEHTITSRFFRRGDTRLHYTVGGNGPTLLFIHGLPDFWNGWRYQIAYFKTSFRVAAVDLRGVNLSDKPSGLAAFRMIELVRDIVALMDELELERASIIGHDWGGIIGWWTAMLVPARVARLASLAAPHPACYLAAKERSGLRRPPEYDAQVVRASPGAPFDAAQCIPWVRDPVVRVELLDALSRSDIECVRHFYRANAAIQSAQLTRLPPVAVPVLTMYGTEDDYIDHDAYAGSAPRVSGDFRLVAVPGAGHFLHQDMAGRVNFELQRWLDSSAGAPSEPGRPARGASSRVATASRPEGARN
jgi:pimeloyl-ACP methyl ester carboxylesterase